ncbi:MAG: hypothetical protein GTO20_27390 [Candidatus Aminicenantes bacterium]|nr:hypothetical protein [Candidatus Aminicenantes bacterium]
MELARPMEQAPAQEVKPNVCVLRGLTQLHAYPRGPTANQNASASRTTVLQTPQRFAAETVVAIASEEELVRCLNS